MLLKNWDIAQLYSILWTSKLTSFNEDSEICYRDYNGKASVEYLNYNEMLQISKWTNDYYSDMPRYEAINDYKAHWSIWVGGDIEDTPARIRPVTERDVVRYEDFDLYSPFYGTNAPNPTNNTIYGQPHVVSAAKYNDKLDQWEKTVTREFKNESKKTITVRELGVYSNEKRLVAREILDTPIRVPSDSYFKVSWTYKVENPHENREVKRIRQYDDCTTWEYWGSDQTLTREVVPDKKERMLFIRQYSIYQREQISKEKIEEIYEDIPLTLNGWTSKHLAHCSPVIAYNGTYATEVQELVTVDFLTPDSTENNLISFKGYNSLTANGQYCKCTMFFLKDNITDIQYIQTFDQADSPSDIVVTKSADEKNIFWLGLISQRLTGQLGMKQVSPDFAFCDNLSYKGSNSIAILADITNATTHHFSLSYSDRYISKTVLKLKAITKIDPQTAKNIPLYEDILVKGGV